MLFELESLVAIIELERFSLDSTAVYKGYAALKYPDAAYSFELRKEVLADCEAEMGMTAVGLKRKVSESWLRRLDNVASWARLLLAP